MSDPISDNSVTFRKSVGNRIKNSVRMKGLTDKEFGDLVGVGESTVRHYYLGTRYPQDQKIIEIAKILNVSLEWLLTGVESNYKPPISNVSELGGNAKIVNAKFYPKIDRVTAGNYSNNVYPDNIIDMVYIDYPKNNCFVVEVEGDSMQCDDPDKSINPGDNLLIDPSETPMQGDLIIIKTSEQRQMVKQYFYRNDLIELHSYNPKHPIIYLDPGQLEYMFRVVYHQPKGRKK